MIKCRRCDFEIPPGDDYYTDGFVNICDECLNEYICAVYDLDDIARALGMYTKAAPQEEQKEEPEQPIEGQIGMEEML